MSGRIQISKETTVSNNPNMKRYLRMLILVSFAALFTNINHVLPEVQGALPPPTPPLELLPQITHKPLETVQPVAIAPANPASNEAAIWQFLQAQGFTREQTAGIMGNLQQEHNFKTDDVPGGLGIAQWIGGRRANLMSRPNYTDLNVQLQFLMDELNGREHVAGAAIRAAGTVEQATVAFQNKFERCGTCHETRRIQYAYAILNRY